MEIKINIEPETIEKHLKDFPAEPKWFSLLMNAEGISKPKHDEEHWDERYVAECIKHNIIPYSIIELEYDSNIKMFAHSTIKSIVPDFHKLSEKARTSALDSIMQGSRMHIFKISAEYAPKEAFEFLKDYLIDRMLKNSYRLDYLDICITTVYCGHHYAEGWRRTGSLYYNGAEKVLCINAKLESTIEKKVEKWIRTLVKK